MTYPGGGCQAVQGAHAWLRPAERSDRAAGAYWNEPTSIA